MINSEVIYPDPNQKTVRVQKKDIQALILQAEKNERKRMRLCAHRSPADILHEMLIVLTKDTYIRPHKHLNKPESFHIIEGLVDVVFFKENGEILYIIKMGDYQSGQCFYYRIEDSFYHALIIHSERLVLHEVTKGPFNRADTFFAPWSPDEKNLKAIPEFQNQIHQKATLYLSSLAR